MRKDHLLGQSSSSFSISSYAQELMCYVGQHMVFTEAEELFLKLKGVSINAKQIERVSHYYGELIEEQDAKRIEEGGIQNYAQEERGQLHYAMLDGSMFLTREQKWKEVKVGRIFKANDQVEISNKRNMITDSQYVAHLGTHEEFLPKFEYYLDQLKSLVIVADGAKWIWKWADAIYPDATQILDFYHAKEHLCEFAKKYFGSKNKRSQWIEEQSQIMLEDDIEIVILNLKELSPSRAKKTEEKRQQLIKYYNRNCKRMRYNVFLKRGLLIGSGAIESAHRNVLQKRMKLSGQRWTTPGFQQIANLRVAYKSNTWHKIKDLTRKAA